MALQGCNLRVPLTMTLVSTMFHYSKEDVTMGKQPCNTTHACADHKGNKVRWKFEFWQALCKWYGCHFIARGGELPQRMQLENRLAYLIPRSDPRATLNNSLSLLTQNTRGPVEYIVETQSWQHDRYVQLCFCQIFIQTVQSILLYPFISSWMICRCYDPYT